MEEKQYSEAYVNMLKEELESAKSIARLLIDALTVSKQCVITWSWNKTFEFPEGNDVLDLQELVNEAIKQNYRIISVTVREYDDTGSPLHGFIVALYPENGKLH